MSQTAKQAKEHIARAKASLGRGESVKSMGSIIEAVKIILAGRIIGRDRFEVDVLLQEYLAEYNRNPEIRQHFTGRGIHVTPYVKYERRRERELVDFMEKTIDNFQALEHRELKEQEEKQEQVKQKWLAKAQELLDKGDNAKAKGFLRRVAEHYGHERGVLTDVGARMLGAGLYFEAGEVLEQAFEANPKDSKALAYAVKAYKNAREFTKMEELYKTALKVFGKHPKTLLNMARMYLDWHKWDEAYDHAKEAYDMDSSLSEAKEIMDTTGRRIFSRRGSTTTSFDF
jgi:tetratricopeptide (TPR) repeat protein